MTDRADCKDVPAQVHILGQSKKHNPRTLCNCIRNKSERTLPRSQMISSAHTLGKTIDGRDVVEHQTGSLWTEPCPFYAEKESISINRQTKRFKLSEKFIVVGAFAVHHERHLRAIIIRADSQEIFANIKFNLAREWPRWWLRNNLVLTASLPLAY